jgi:hypothetical protein
MATATAPLDPSQQALLDQIKQTNNSALATTAATNAETQRFQVAMNALNAQRESNTAAFNSVNKSVEEIQSR